MIASFFFFQAEDGIRDGHVTGVQTCALPICTCWPPPLFDPKRWLGCKSLLPERVWKPRCNLYWANRQRKHRDGSGRAQGVVPIHVPGAFMDLVHDVQHQTK